MPDRIPKTKKPEPIRIWVKAQTPIKIQNFLQEKGVKKYKWAILIPKDYQKGGIADEGYTNWLLKIAHGRYQMNDYIVAFLNYDPKLLFGRKYQNHPIEIASDDEIENLKIPDGE
jgi:hypothetical protein